MATNKLKQRKERTKKHETRPKLIYTLLSLSTNYHNKYYTKESNADNDSYN